MRHKLMDHLEQSPVIPAVKAESALPCALACESRVLFLLGGDLLTIRRWISLVHEADKLAVVHIDLVGGLAPREVAVDWLQQQGADGIISTRPGHAHGAAGVRHRLQGRGKPAEGDGNGHPGRH